MKEDMHKTKVKEFLRTKYHKKPVRAVTTAALLLGLPFIGAYAYFLAVKRLKLEKINLELHAKKSGLTGLKIIQISDLHYGPTNKDHPHFHHIIDIINAQHPDLVLLTGDYYQWDPAYLNNLPQILSRVRAPLGVFGTLGNHDYGSCYPGELKNDPFEYTVIRETFERNGIHMLTNESAQLEFNGQKFNLVGLHDLWSGLFDPETAFKKVDTKLPTFVLSHNPDTAGLIEHDFDLMLSGHCHGGQVTLPWLGAILTPIKNKNFKRGLHTISERKKLYVNRGLGHTFRMRLNSPPEITLIEIL